ncbi:AAA family ATPase [Corynebacterium pelargi]|uniref:ATP-dependent dethiobiotin synthetase BioD n=1 Tax=Corynebacterium pelargi TaxID=1471400 RepID=A0A410W921_9CORY|nr:AAA family ATPase [Corynebacterium pelargi]QAU52453.1 ATP-dependent dethiobiotin synthetase BioD [Corynebacterium pelargi]GGG67560.1 ATP-dependent dethiobiotin synthetase BioD [Corynebacterium pelargi]
MGVIVVSGLSTGVGKTTAAAAIVAVLKARGRDVVPVKVARLQGSLKDPHAGDIGTIERLTGIRGLDLSDDPNPLQRVRELVAEGKTVVVEGSGALSIPLLANKTIADIAAELGAPLVVVSGMAEGAVSLAVQAVRFARMCGADVVGVVGGKLPSNADLRTRLKLMEVSNSTGVDFFGSLPDGIGASEPEAFWRYIKTVTLPPSW